MNNFLAKHLFWILIGSFLISCNGIPSQQKTKSQKTPNVLLVIADDQSYPHSSIYGYEAIKTPSFDKIAQEGVLFTKAFAGSPGCSPSRAALLTGRHCWQLEHAGTHASLFSPDYTVYPDLLEQAGYAVGFTGKGWAPGNWQASGRTRNPAGNEWNQIRYEEVPEGISDKNYTANFKAFLDSREGDQPFCFWFGAHEPHRKFGQGLGEKAGKNPDLVDVPAFLPDTQLIRSDILDYCFEIEWYDRHLGEMIEMLKAAGELDNTLIIVTADNGMAFPRAKANAYEYGIHVPLAVRWGDRVSAGRTVDDLVGFVDLAPTILEACGLEHAGAFPMIGQSILPILLSDKSDITDPNRTAVFSSRERHSSSRYHSLAYPQRAMRTHDYLYIRNFKPERWPAGTPTKYGVGNYPSQEEVQNQILGPAHGGYHDIDACPSLTFLVDNRDSEEVGPYFHLAIDKRPAEELFDMRNDPECLHNLVTDPAHAQTLETLRKQMMAELTATKDPRVLGNGDVWETYPRFSRLRAFPTPDWAEEHPEDIPKQAWLEKHWEAQWGK